MEVQEHNQIQELEELIELAGDVSKNIQIIKQEAHNHLFLITLGLGAYGLFQYVISRQLESWLKNISEIPSPLSITLFSFFFTIMVISILLQQSLLVWKKKEVMKKERLILADLLDRIHAIKQFSFQYLDESKKSLIEMKLNRIRYLV